MNERKHLIKRWQLANYTGVKRFTFWKVSAKICNFRVPIYKGVPYNIRVPVYKGFLLPWMKWHPFFIDGGLPSVLVWKDWLSEKWVLKHATLGFPLIRGSPPMNEMTPILYRWRLAKCTFPWHERNDTHPLMMTASQVYKCVRVSLSENCGLNNATLGFPFMTAEKVLDCEIVLFLPWREWNLSFDDKYESLR